MADFDIIFVGLWIPIIGLILSVIGEKKRKEKIFAAVAVSAFLIILIILAYHFNWESSILQISGTPNSDSHALTTESPVETVDHFFSVPTTTPKIEDAEVSLGEAYEKHMPDDGITASVEFRAWDSATDKDLRNDTYVDASGISYFSSFSNIFNAVGGGGSEGDKIDSEIHIPISHPINVDSSDLYLVGSIVAEQRTQGSSAYADVAILIDGVEKWRSEDHITSTTVQPIEFTVNLADVKSEIVIRTFCVPLDNGLSLGFVGIDISRRGNVDSQQPSTQDQDTNSEEEVVFARAFESHSPKNNGIDFVEFRAWDTFSDEDLRGEQYVNIGGLFLKISNTFSMLGSSIENQVESEIHLVVNPKKELENSKWTGSIVAEHSTLGSTAYADIAIYVDGVEKWRTSESITGNTVAPVDFSVDLSDALYEVIIKIYCTPNDNGLALGIVNMDFNYS